MLNKFLNIFRIREQTTESEHIKTIAAGSLSYAIATVASAIISFISLPLVIAALGTEQYGLFVLLAAIAGFLGFSDFGLLTGLVNKISYLKTEEKLKEANKIISGAYIFFSVTIGFLVVAGVATIIFGPEWILNKLNIKEGLQTLSIVTLSLIAVTWIVNNIFSGILKSLYSGLNQLPYYNYINLLYSVGYGIIYITFLLFKPSLIGIVTFLFLAGIVRFTILYIKSRKIFPDLELQINSVSFKSILPLLSYTPVFLTLSVVATVIGRSDVIVISHYLGLSMVGIYALSYKLFKIPSDTLKVTDAAFPSAAELYKKGELQTLSNIYSRVVRINLVMRIAILGIVAVFSQEILHLWLGKGFFISYELVGSLFFLFVVFAWTAPHVILMQGLFLYKKHVIPSLFYLLVTVLLFVFLTPRIGVVAVPLSIGVGNLIANGVYVPGLLKKYLPIKPFVAGLKVLVVPLLFLILLILLRMAILNFIDNTWMQLMTSLLGTVGFIISIALIGLTTEEREFISRKVLSRI